MPTLYPRPTFDQLRSRIAADMAFMPSVLSGPLSAAWARSCSGLHGHMEWLYAQGTPLTCTAERLSDWAELYGVPRLLATPASGSVVVAGSAGAALLRDAVLRGPSGVDYRVDLAANVIDGLAQARVVCVIPGEQGNLPGGATLTLVDPVVGLSDTAVVSSEGLTGGAQDETEDAWRARVVEEWRTITTTGARGGRAQDYVYWARAAHPSVTSALVELGTVGMGTVVVRPICNGLAQRLPTAAVSDAVLDYLQGRAPVMPEIFVVPPSLLPVAISLELSAAVDSAAVRAAIEAAVTAAVLAETADGALLRLAEIDYWVSTVTDQYTRVAPAADVLCGPGEILALPTFSWV